MRFFEQMRDVLITRRASYGSRSMSSFSMLRSGRRNTRITLQPFKLYP